VGRTLPHPVLFSELERHFVVADVQRRAVSVEFTAVAAPHVDAQHAPLGCRGSGARV